MDNGLETDVRRIWELLFAIVLDSEKRMAHYLAARGLTTPQFYVLKTLTEHEGRCPIGQIARLHGLTNATMTGLVKRLEAMGLVAREQNHHDRRSVHVLLTKDGAARFQDVQRDLLDQLHVILSLLQSGEREILLQYLTRYVETIVHQFPVMEA